MQDSSKRLLSSSALHGITARQEEIQAVYERHRTNRNAQQKEKLLADTFPGITIDEILAKLEDPTSYPGYVDPRNCLVFWARPTAAIMSLIAGIQSKLCQVVPGEAYSSARDFR